MKIHAIPSPIDFADLEQARAWTADTIARRPWRPRFFAAFCAALTAHFDGPIRIAELGSGPGHLAGAILRGCAVRSYCAVDFSPAMHSLAREHLDDLAPQVRFVLADFRDPHWSEGLQPIDALVTLQAAHELRHASRLPELLTQIREALRPGGLLLFADHYAKPGNAENSGLYLTREEQPEHLALAGFAPVRLLHDEGGAALYAAERH